MCLIMHNFFYCINLKGDIFMCEKDSKLFEELEMIEDDIEISDEDIESEQFFLLKGAGVTNE